MAGTTTNNAWTYPTSTDLLKDGASAIQTLATGIDTSTGKGLIAWQTWAPTITSGGSPAWANGNGVYNYAKYCQIGKTVHFFVQFTLGTTTTKATANVMSMSLPVTMATNSMGHFVGRCSVAGTSYYLNAFPASTSAMSFYAQNASATYLTAAGVTSAVPGTWVTSDTLSMYGTYEAA
jgi:hypothetical protein